MYKIIKILFLATVYLAILNLNSILYAKNNLEISGNKKISNETVKNLINFNKDNIYTPTELNEMYKKLMKCIKNYLRLIFLKK